MTAIFQATFSDAFSWMKMYKFRSRFHWSLFLRVQLTIFQHCFIIWINVDISYRRIYECVTRPQWVNPSGAEMATFCMYYRFTMAAVALALCVTSWWPSDGMGQVISRYSDDKVVCVLNTFRSWFSKVNLCLIKIIPKNTQVYLSIS